MARGEGAEQCAATLLAVKPLNADIKAAKVRNSRFPLSSHERPSAKVRAAAPYLAVRFLSSAHTPLRRLKRVESSARRWAVATYYYY